MGLPVQDIDRFCLSRALTVDQLSSSTGPLLWQEFVAGEGQHFAIGRPGWNVHRATAAEQLRNRPHPSIEDRQDPDLDVLIGWMALRARLVSKVRDRLAIG